jgi:hypothetical protein
METKLRNLFICLLFLMTAPLMAKTVTFYGTLPEGASVRYERVYSASRWVPGCGRWEHWGLGFPEWVGKIQQDEGEAVINGNEYTLKINLAYHKKFCKYGSQEIYLEVQMPQPNGDIIKSSRIEITTLDSTNNPSIPELKYNYKFECKSEEYGMPDEYGYLRKVDCYNINRNYLWGEFNINKLKYDEKPIRIDFSSKYID